MSAVELVTVCVVAVVVVVTVDVMAVLWTVAAVVRVAVVVAARLDGPSICVDKTAGNAVLLVVTVCVRASPSVALLDVVTQLQLAPLRVAACVVVVAFAVKRFRA